MKRILSLFLLGISMLALVGCGGGGMKSTAGHLNLAIWWFGETLDPAHAWDGWTLTRIAAGETLVTVNEHMEFAPQLADRWENVDPVTWRFHIRPGVKFQNGDPMTPELVKASIERTLSESERAKKSARIKEIRVDGEDLVFETTEPYASFVATMTDPVFIIVNTKDLSNVDSTPILTGPYQITGWTKGVEIQLKRNEHYWDGTPGLQTVTVKKVEDDGPRAMSLQSGEFDLIQRMSAANRSLFENNPDYTIYEATGIRVQMLTLNQEGVFADQNLRDAVSCLFDRQALAAVYGNASPADEVFPSSVPYGHSGEKISYDPTKAAAAFAAAGWTKNAQGIYEKNGTPLMVRFGTWGDKTTLYEGIESQLRAGGVDVKMVHAQEPTMIESAGGFDLLEEDLTVATTNDPYTWLNGMFSENGALNRGHYKSPEMNAILQNMATAMDPARKDALVTDAARQLLKDKPVVFLIVPTTTLVGKSNVKNVKIFPLDCYLLTKDVTVE